MALVTVRDIRKRYVELEIIQSVDCDIEHCSFVVLLGLSDCDKSTHNCSWASLASVCAIVRDRLSFKRTNVASLAPMPELVQSFNAFAGFAL